MQRYINLYVISLLSISLILSVYWLTKEPLHLSVLPLFIILMVIGELYKVPVILYGSKEYVKISWSLVVSISVLVGAGVSDAIIINLIGGIVCSFFPKKLPAIKILYNVGSYIASVVTTYTFYKILEYNALLPGSNLFELFYISILYLTINFLINIQLMKFVTMKTYSIIIKDLITPHLHNFILFSFIGGIQGYFYKQNGMITLIPTSILIALVLYSFKNTANTANERILELQSSNDKMEKLASELDNTLDAFIHTLTATIDARDPYTYGHSLQVSNYSLALATELGLNDEEVETIRIAGLLHDIGKISIPEEILFKEGRLTEQEYEIMKQHSKIGEEILSEIPSLEKVAKLVGMHHERFNGTGYPNKLMADQIPLGAHILGVADTLDAILSTRSYKKERSVEEAMEEFKRCKGRHFHPDVVDALSRIRNRVGDEAFANSAKFIDLSQVQGKIKTNRNYFYSGLKSGYYNRINLVRVK